MTAEAPSARQLLSDPTRIRKVVVPLTIGSFCCAAVVGIVALLRGGEFGATESRVMLTTLLVGVVSIAVLCCLSTAGRPSRPVGVAGGVAALVMLVTGLLMIWGVWGYWEEGGKADKTLQLSALAAATLAQASLLLTLGERAGPRVRGILAGTLVLAAVLAVILAAEIAGVATNWNGYFDRVLGTIAILDLLGTVVVVALTKFVSGDLDRPRVDARLPPDLADGVAELAIRSGRSRDGVVAEAVRSYLRERR